ncbi:MAG: acyltransferase [Proteobacteria bacterium]|nr:acyltransferase [Pseudomonadota bacterium]
MAAPTLRTRGETRDNQCDLVRIVAAAGVLFAHAYALTRHSADEPLYRVAGLNAGNVAVWVFFTLSGYLVAQSLARRADVRSFVAMRAARLAPGLAVAAVVTAWVVGPWVTTLPPSTYVQAAGTLRYVPCALLPPAPEACVLPGVFAANPYPDAVNGSLWTLPVEMAAYAGLLLAGVAGMARNRIAATVVVAGLAALPAAVRAAGAEWPLTRETTNLLGFFAAGTLLYAWGDRVPHSPWVLGVLAVVGIGTWRIAHLYAPVMLAIAYAVLWVGLMRPSRIRWPSRWGDWSYGVYIYAFPLQQAIVAQSGTTSPRVLLLVSLPVTLAVAALSWRLVEGPALRRTRAWLAARGVPAAAR